MDMPNVVSEASLLAQYCYMDHCIAEDKIQLAYLEESISEATRDMMLEEANDDFASKMGRIIRKTVKSIQELIEKIRKKIQEAWEKSSLRKKLNDLEEMLEDHPELKDKKVKFIDPIKLMDGFKEGIKRLPMLSINSLLG